MYHKLARGYATEFLGKLQTHEDVETWFSGPKCRKAMSSFEASCLSKKPGRCAKRLAPFLKPAFEAPIIGLWHREMKMAFAAAISAAPESQVFDLGGEDEILFRERSAFLNNVFLSDDGEEVSARLLTVSNISHHALSRIVEREMATPEALPGKTRRILEIARNMAMTLPFTDLDEDCAQEFLIPFGGGALPAVTMRVHPGSRERFENRRVISIRTWLGAEMLKPEDHERMGGFDRALDDYGSSDGKSGFVRWMEINARPWTRWAAIRGQEDCPITASP